MPQIPEFQFGLSKDELRAAVKALNLDLNVDAGDQLDVNQLRAWLLVRDCYLGDLSARCSQASDRAQAVGQPAVQTKRERSMARFRR